MPVRTCKCTHPEAEHELVTDFYSKEGGSSRRKCTVLNCKCTQYNFNHEKFMYDRGYEDRANGKEPQM